MRQLKCFFFSLFLSDFSKQELGRTSMCKKSITHFFGRAESLLLASIQTALLLLAYLVSSVEESNWCKASCSIWSFLPHCNHQGLESSLSSSFSWSASIDPIFFINSTKPMSSPSLRTIDMQSRRINFNYTKKA